MKTTYEVTIRYEFTVEAENNEQAELIAEQLVTFVATHPQTGERVWPDITCDRVPAGLAT